MSQLPPDSKLRPEVLDSLRRPEERKPKRLGAFSLVAVAVQAGVAPRLVPENYWRSATDVQGHAQAVIDCPCGHASVVDLGCGPNPCVGGCGRWFFYGGVEVTAFGAPLPAAPAE